MSLLKGANPNTKSKPQIAASKTTSKKPPNKSKFNGGGKRTGLSHQSKVHSQMRLPTLNKKKLQVKRESEDQADKNPRSKQSPRSFSLENSLDH